MSLETPDRIRASAVLLIEDFLTTPTTATIRFASNNGFGSVRFIDTSSPAVGAVLAMDQPVNNQEGALSVGGDFGLAGPTSAYITPNHFVTGIVPVDGLDPFQVAILGLGGSADVFRMTATVFKMTEVLAPLEGEPVT